MTTIHRLWVANDNDVVLTGLRLDADGSAINDANLRVTVARAARTGPITHATNAAPIVLTSAGHGLSAGDQIAVVGVAGTAAANGVWTIGVPDPDSIELIGSAGDGSYLWGGTWYVTVPGGGDLAVPYVAGTDGTYRGILPDSLPLEADQEYLLWIRATNYGLSIQRKVPALVRP